MTAKIYEDFVTLL